jgi:hypothetical protein
MSAIDGNLPFLLRRGETTPMPGPPYRGLRIILGILSLLSAVGGIVISSGRPIASRCAFFPGAPSPGSITMPLTSYFYLDCGPPLTRFVTSSASVDRTFPE